MASDDAVTFIHLLTAPDWEAGTVAHSRAWRVPAGLAEAIAQVMTECFGPPAEEVLSTVGALRAARVRDLAEGGFLFASGENDGG